MRTALLLATSLFVFCSCIIIQETPPPAPPQTSQQLEEEEELPPRTPHICRFTTQPIKVDGIREKAWDQAEIIDCFRVFTLGTLPVSKTKAWMLWDKQAFYVFIEASDRDVWSLLDKRDALTYSEDALEIFMAYGPAKTAVQYINFEINAIGTVYDAYYFNRFFNLGAKPPRWNCHNLQSATKINGTINQHNDEDQGWCLEIAIPFASIPWMQGRTAPIDGEEWSAHIGRYDYSIFLHRGCELSSSTPFTKRSFHKVYQFQPLIFRIP